MSSRVDVQSSRWPRPCTLLKIWIQSLGRQVKCWKQFLLYILYMWPIKCHLLLHHHHAVLTSDISALTAFTQNFDLSTLRDFYPWLIWRSGQHRGSGEVDVMFSHSWKPLTHVLFVKHPHTNLSQNTWIYHVCLTWLVATLLMLLFRV